jgi:hypothetical protein
MDGPVVAWSDEVDEVIAGDLTAAAAYLTPAGGTIVTGVAPCGLRDRERGVVSFTTSLGIGRKLEHIIANPQVALAFHTREHGYSVSPRFVVVQGLASVDLVPHPDRLEALIPEAERHLGAVKSGPVWNGLLREYYRERVFVDITVQRIVSWPDLAAAGAPEVNGRPMAEPPAAQASPRNGTGPRIAMDTMVHQIAALPHRVLAYRGTDGMPVVVPVAIGSHDSAGMRLVGSPDLLPLGARRAGFLAHSYHPHLIGLSTRMFTGWLEVAADGDAVYAPHTSKGFRAPPFKNLMLVSNGLFAKYGMWNARRTGLLEKLQQLSGAEPGAVT